MDENVERHLLEILKAYGQDDLVRDALKARSAEKSRKTAYSNPLENSMWENMLDGALKAMEIVALASFDWKLAACLKLFDSWMKDKREEKRKKQQDLTKGVNYNITHPQFQVTQPDPYGGRYTY